MRSQHMLKSGLHYTHVVRDCPAYKDLVQCVKNLAAHHAKADRESKEHAMQSQVPFEFGTGENRPHGVRVNKGRSPLADKNISGLIRDLGDPAGVG